MESRVIFTGALYDEEKKAAFADADLFVLPSRYENFANAPAEAMACGVPVIITDACGIRSLVEGQAGLVIPPEKQALTDALRKMLGDKILYARFKEGCSPRRQSTKLGTPHRTNGRLLRESFGGNQCRPLNPKTPAPFTTSIRSIGRRPARRNPCAPLFRRCSPI